MAGVPESKKDSPEPPETVLRLFRLEERVTVLSVEKQRCRIVAEV